MCRETRDRVRRRLAPCLPASISILVIAYHRFLVLSPASAHGPAIMRLMRSARGLYRAGSLRRHAD